MKFIILKSSFTTLVRSTQNLQQKKRKFHFDECKIDLGLKP